MELKRKSPFRTIFTILYIVAFFAFTVGYFALADGTAYTIDGGLVIPSIDLTSGVTKLELKDHELKTPDSIVGSYTRSQNKVFLIGHSTTIFKDLHRVNIGDEIIYNNTRYSVSTMEVYRKSDIDMNDVLKPEEVETIVLMTCAGEPIDGVDATHRLIVTAQKI